MRKAIFALTLMVLAEPLFAGSAALSLLNQGNDYYRQGDYPRAISEYQRALQSGIPNSDLYYNLGNAYYKSGDLGRAALCWWRSERLNPADPDLIANLALAQKIVSDQFPIQEKKSLTDFFQQLRDLGPARKWGIWFSGSIWGFWVCLFLYLIFRGRRVKRILLSLNLILAAMMLLTGLGFGARRHFENEPAGVVIAAKVSARSGPGENFSALFELPAGARVLVRECGSGYCKVGFPPGMIGWVEGKAIERI